MDWKISGVFQKQESGRAENQVWRRDEVREQSGKGEEEAKHGRQHKA